MSGPNYLLMTQIGLQLATQLQQLIATQAQAHAEGRDVSDAELDGAAKQAQAAIDQLSALKR
ncbi:MAG TPA: hypothetical protein VFS24_01030 [Steroidobacteraceae bacterium]|nr:hypothetical protein [Steroidobacteraceae bacterium]